MTLTRWLRAKAPPSPASGSAERLEPAAPVLERLAEERLDRRPSPPSEPEDVERDVDHGDLGPDRRRRRLPAEPGLERDERQDGAVAPGEDLAVEDPVPGEAAGALDDLRELAADVVQVARVEPDVVAVAVELGADPVVLVLDPDRHARAASRSRRRPRPARRA